MSHEQLIDVALKFYEAIGTAASSKLSDALQAGEWDRVVTASTDPGQYLSAHSYRLDAAATSFLRKLEDAPTTINTRDVCYSKWLQIEKHCFKVNQRLSHDLEGETPSTAGIEFLGAVRKKIARLFGRVPSTLNLGFGKGSTFQHKGQRYLIPDKMSTTPEMTGEAWVHLREFSQTAWARALRDELYSQIRSDRVLEVPIVRGNRWGSVPKTALIDRAIGVEPTLNLSVQLAIGKHLKGQLKLSGLLTSDAEQIHRTLAKKASVDGSLATIDLSSASDTVTTTLVRTVVPYEWHDLLSSVRSPYTKVPTGAWVRLEKFSSMGNGYTFELETAIFASICRVVADRYHVRLIPGINFSVYGDDIIVPTQIATECIAALKYCGFLINFEKSFTTGPFRESCGGDYFEGANVRPIFCKTVPSSPPEWITLYNQVKTLEDYIDVRDVLRTILNYIPSTARVFGPSSLGDIVLHGETEDWTMKRSDGLLFLSTIQPEFERIPLNRWDVNSFVASKLYGIRGKSIVARDSIIGYRKAWVCLAL